jgi:putative addiction module killer protein
MRWHPIRIVGIHAHSPLLRHFLGKNKPIIPRGHKPKPTIVIGKKTPSILANPYTLVYTCPMLEIKRTDGFVKWLKKLKDANAKARINLRVRRIELTGNLGDFKPVDEGVSEIRIDYGPGYRVYFGRRGNEIILLLIGGDKSTQQRDIAKAKQLNKEYEQDDKEDKDEEAEDDDNKGKQKGT